MKTLLLALLLLTGALAASAQCRDPWITDAYKKVANRVPVGQGETCECNIKLYNNGSWGNFDELTGFVRQFLASGTRVGYLPLGDGRSVMVVADGSQIVGVSMLSSSGQVIAAGGANVVAAGGGNVVAAGGGNMVAAGGGNLTGLNANTAGFQFGGQRSVLATGQIRKPTSGAGSIIIQKR
ncbi:hypothetical protein [Hymenobacter pini]|uniref:hypothetical protein n=1 Tax=Hymenobacter pini TaxID=2880879 RepID=UPI001CF4303D|nr:hypothetical protein [Hymenobacter pini]MCA8833200.1 hypothetical protein [Hymenobacter pini]